MQWYITILSKQRRTVLHCSRKRYLWTSSRIGNADEALYQEEIHPATTVPELSENALRDLYDAIQVVLDAAIAADSDPTALDPDQFMLPHRYGDEHCPKTGVPLETEQVSGRTAYFSPARQTPPNGT